MRVFISWSGEKSKRMASELRDWLPLVIQSAEPFMSDRDIDGGDRWATELATELDQCNFGIICLTPDNLNAPWLMFEAGALAKSTSRGHVLPYLLDLTLVDIKGPLAGFQACMANREGTLKLVSALDNAMADKGLGSQRLLATYDQWWPKLDLMLTEVRGTGGAIAPLRSDRDLLEEIVTSLRSMSMLNLSHYELNARPSVLHDWVRAVMEEMPSSAEPPPATEPKHIYLLRIRVPESQVYPAIALLESYNGSDVFTLEVDMDGSPTARHGANGMTRYCVGLMRVLEDLIGKDRVTVSRMLTGNASGR